MTDNRHRILIGTDTYTAGRWTELSGLVANTRQWLNQLPGPIAADIAYGNAKSLFSDEPSHLK